MAASTSDDPRHIDREQSLLVGVEVAARWSGRIVVIALALALLGLVIKLTWSVLLPIILAVLLCTALHPISRLIQRVGLPSGVGAAGAVLGVIVVLFGLTAGVAPGVAPQVSDLAEAAARSLDDTRAYLRDSPLRLTDAKFDGLVENAQSRLTNSAEKVAAGLLVTLGALTSVAVNLLITLVLAFLFLKDGHRFLPWLRGAAGPTAGHHLSEVLLRIWTTIATFVRAQMLVGVIDAAAIGTALVVLRVPLALPLALLTFLAAFIPVVGAITVGALAVLVALVSNGLVTALIVLAVVIAVQQIEGNILLPWLQGRSLGLHAATVLLAIVLGSALFGVVGAFLSVPVVASVAVVLTYLGERASAPREDVAEE